MENTRDQPVLRELLRRPHRVSMGHRGEQEKCEVPDEDGASPRGCVGALLHLQLLLGVPASLPPPRPSRPHTANSLFLPLWCVFKYEKTKIRSRKEKTKIWVNMWEYLTLFCPWDKVSILRGEKFKKLHYLVTYCSLISHSNIISGDEIGSMVAQIKMGFMIGWKLFYVKTFCWIKRKRCKRSAHFKKFFSDWFENVLLYCSK